MIAQQATCLQTIAVQLGLIAFTLRQPGEGLSLFAIGDTTQLVAILFLFLCQSKVAEHLCQLNCYSLATMSLFVEEFLKFLFFMLFADLSQ